MERTYPRMAKLKPASKITGFSEYYLRQGCKAGTIAHVRSGRDIYVDLDAFFRQLDEQARAQRA